jgi:hypothetical protein
MDEIHSRHDTREYFWFAVLLIGLLIFSALGA